jgi:DNA polymerase III gamma/tau subunit
VCRELSRAVRDLLVLSVDPSRVQDPEIAGEGERERLLALAKRFSREDLLRAFDLLTRAETDIRGDAQPRYQLEMALLRWIYVQKLVSIEDLIAGSGGPGREGGQGRTVAAKAPAPSTISSPPSRASTSAAPAQSRTSLPSPPVAAPSASAAPASSSMPKGSVGRPDFKDAFLAEIRKSKVVFYNTVVAQALKIEVAGDQVTFSFAKAHRALRDQFEQNRSWLEGVAQQTAGRKVMVSSVQVDGLSAPAESSRAAVESGDRKMALREQALADASVQALLEVFPAEIRDIEEM